MAGLDHGLTLPDGRACQTAAETPQSHGVADRSLEGTVSSVNDPSTAVMKSLPRESETKSRALARGQRASRPGSRLSTKLAGCFAVFAIALAGCDRPHVPATRGETVLSSPPPETVILVVVDTLRADRLGCLGGKTDLTPNLDAFAETAVRFTDAGAHAPWTLPSFGSILTGVVPTALWEPGTGGRLRNELRTLPEVLAERGYRTFACVNHRLFDPPERTGLQRGFAPDDWNAFPARNDFTRSARETVDETLEWIDGLESGQRAFTLIHFFDPHLDYRPPRDLVDPGILALGNGEHRFRPGAEAFEPGWDPSPDRRRWIEGLHDAEVRATDRAFGDFVDGLRERGRLDDALIVVTSDHGEEFWDHGGFEHGHTLYRELVHVPLLIRFPRDREGGRVVEETVRHIDLMPTLLDLAGAPVPEACQGTSLRSLLVPDSARESRPIVAEFLLYGAERKSIRAGSHKLVCDVDRQPVALFDLERDPAELQDRLEDKPEVAERLRQELVRWVGRREQAPPERFSFRADPDLRARLAELGYLERSLRGSDPGKEPTPSLERPPR